MSKSTFWIAIAIPLVIPTSLFLSGCACDAEEFVHEFDVAYSLDNNVMSTATSFQLRLVMPDMAVDLLTEEAVDISDLDIDFGVLIHEFRSDEVPEFWQFYPQASSDFQIEVIQGELVDEDPSLVKPASTNGQKELVINFTPTRQDTFLIGLNIQGSTRSAGGPGLGCGSFHTLSLHNRDLLYQDHFSGLSDSLAHIVRDESSNGLLVIEVK